MRAHDGRVVPAFICEALDNKPLTVFGDGSQTRSFCFCSDLVRGIRLLLSSEYSLPLNLGNPDEMSILRFAYLVNQVVGNAAAIVHKPLPVDDPKVRRPDIARAREILGWEPQVGLEEGLAQTIRWFRRVLESR